MLVLRRYFCSNLSNRSKLELTLAIIKPHICKDPSSVEDIHQMIISNGFFFIQTKYQHMKLKQAEEFYEEHQGKFFYNRLISMMTSGECWMHILAAEQAITRWRKLMGTTKVYKTRLEQPDTIRGQFGCTDTRNATHGSDSPETVRRESRILFPEFDFDHWFINQEPKFRNESTKIILDQNEWIHKIDN